MPGYLLKKCWLQRSYFPDGCGVCRQGASEWRKLHIFLDTQLENDVSSGCGSCCGKTSHGSQTCTVISMSEVSSARYVSRAKRGLLIKGNSGMLLTLYNIETRDFGAVLVSIQLERWYGGISFFSARKISRNETAAQCFAPMIASTQAKCYFALPVPQGLQTAYKFLKIYVLIVSVRYATSKVGKVEKMWPMCLLCASMVIFWKEAWFGQLSMNFGFAACGWV